MKYHIKTATIALFMGVFALLVSAVVSQGAQQALLGKTVTWMIWINPTNTEPVLEMYHSTISEVANGTANDKLIIYLNKDIPKNPGPVTVSTAHKYLDGTGALKGTAFPSGQKGENGGYRKWPYGPIQEDPMGPPLNDDTGITIHFVDTYGREFTNTDLFMVDPRFNGSMVYTHQGDGVWRLDASVIVPVAGGGTPSNPISGSISVAGFWVWVPLWKKTGGSPMEGRSLSDLSGGEWRANIDRIIMKAYYEPASFHVWTDEDWGWFAASGFNNSDH
jgi:hypothetical protein